MAALIGLRRRSIASMDAESAARAWVDGWMRAWPAHDVEGIVVLYAEDAFYLSHPFREPHLGRTGVMDYVRSAFAEEDDVECWFGEPVVSGDRAAVEYRAVITYRGREQTLAGTTLLRFAPDGRVVEHRDYWAMEEGRRARAEPRGG